MVRASPPGRLRPPGGRRRHPRRAPSDPDIPHWLVPRRASTVVAARVRGLCQWCPPAGTPDLPRPATPSPWAASPRRWPRPRLTPGILTAVQDRYQLSWQGEPVDLGGSSNLNVHLPGDSGGYVLRVHRSWVSGPRLTVVQAVRSRLVRAGLPFLEPIQTRDQQGWLELDGHHLLEVEKYVWGEDMEMGDRLLAGPQRQSRRSPARARLHQSRSGGDPWVGSVA